MLQDQLLLEVNTRGKFSISDTDSKFLAYKELADKKLIKLTMIGSGVYVVSKK